jgi:hypothetical protein
LNHEIGGESASIPFDGQVKIAGGDLIEVGQVRIQHDLLFTQ